MKRRLTMAIVGTVAAALVLAGLGTLLLARLGTAVAIEADLRDQADAVAELALEANRGFIAVSEVQTDALIAQVCDEPLGDSSEAAQQASDRVRAAVCSVSFETLDETADQVCSEAWDPLGEVVEGEVIEKRLEFCDDPTDARLEEFRRSLCQATVTVSNKAIRRQFTAARDAVCRTVRRSQAQRDELSLTLQEQEIALIVVQSDNSISVGELSEGLEVNDLQLDRLRAGETTSGRYGDRVWAAAPLTYENGELTLVGIGRSASPMGDTLRWFLIAAGLTLLLGVVVADRLGRRLTAPLRSATDAAGRIAAGDLDVRLDEHDRRRRPDELDELGHAINEMTSALQRSQGLERQFLLSVSHDLRTPLTSIRGYAEAIADGAIPDVEDAAAVILNESRRLERLVADLLQLAKLESRSFSFELVDIDLGEVMADAAEGFRQEATSAGIQLVLRAPDEPVMAEVDVLRLQQVIANLVENALRFATSTVELSVIEDGNSPRLEIADDGPGIAAEDLPHVFERLYVASRRPKRRETGSGLGLAIVRELVEAMGGDVQAVGRPGGGTKLVVSLRRREHSAGRPSGEHR